MVWGNKNYRSDIPRHQKTLALNNAIRKSNKLEALPFYPNR